MQCDVHAYRGLGECPVCRMSRVTDQERLQRAEEENERLQASTPACKAAGHAEDLVNHPKHYTSHPSGIECIQVTEHMNFNVGNAVKYLWRCDEKGNHLQDLKKAAWYIDREIKRREPNAAR